MKVVEMKQRRWLQRYMVMVCASVLSCVILSLSQAHLVWLLWISDVTGVLIYVSMNIKSPPPGAIYEAGTKGFADVPVEAENISWVELPEPYEIPREFVIHSYAEHLYDDYALIIFQPGEIGRKWNTVASAKIIPEMVGAYGCRALTRAYEATYYFIDSPEPWVEDVHIYAVIGETDW